MANYPIRNIKISGNVFELPVPKSYSINFGTNASISSWPQSGQSLNITGFFDQDGNRISDVSVLLSISIFILAKRRK